MLKKQMLLMLAAGCVVSGAFAEGQKEALEINPYAPYLEGCTDKIQGVEILDVLHGRAEIPANVSVAWQYKDDWFRETKKLRTFNQEELIRCNRALILPRDKAELKECDRDHLLLVKQLINGDCVLCRDGDEEVIVAQVFGYALGAPEKVCKKLERSEQRPEKLRQEKAQRADEMQKQAYRNAGMTSHASRRAKEQREAAKK